MKWFVFLFTLTLVACASHATPIVTKDSDSVFSPGFPVITNLGGNRWRIDIDMVETGTCCGFFVYIESDASDIIEEINITGSGPVSTTMHLVIRGDEPSGSITSVESVNYYTPGGGRIPARLTLTVDLHPSLGTGRIGNAAGTSTIEAHRFNRITARSISADILTIAGIGDSGIAEFDINGDIGSSTNTVNIGVVNDIKDLRAKNIYADIDVGGNVESIQVFGSGDTTTAATDAVFEGSLNCDTMNLGAGLRIWGDLDANVNIADGMTGGMVDTTRIAIGKDLNGDITIGSGGMSRGITIGWMPGATGAWTGNVTVNGVTLSPKPDYTQDPAGNGAVGLVPYGAHLFECTPAYTVSGPGSIDVTGTETKSITIAHYGYVRNLGTGKPFTVTHAAGPHCDGTCIHATNYDVTSDWDLVSLGTGNFRHMVVEGPVIEGQHYHIVVNSALECWDVFGTPGTATTPYVFVFYAN